MPPSRHLLRQQWQQQQLSRSRSASDASGSCSCAGTQVSPAAWVFMCNYIVHVQRCIVRSTLSCNSRDCAGTQVGFAALSFPWKQQMCMHLTQGCGVRQPCTGHTAFHPFCLMVHAHWIYSAWASFSISTVTCYTLAGHPVFLLATTSLFVLPSLLPLLPLLSPLLLLLLLQTRTLC